MNVLSKKVYIIWHARAVAVVLGCIFLLLASQFVSQNMNTAPDNWHKVRKNTVQALKYPSAHAVTLYMPGFKAIHLK